MEILNKTMKVDYRKWDATTGNEREDIATRIRKEMLREENAQL